MEVEVGYKNSDHRHGPPTVMELTAVEKAWLHDCQHLTYAAEIASISPHSESRTPLNTPSTPLPSLRREDP